MEWLLIFDKLNFRPRKITSVKDNDKRINPSRRWNGPDCVHTKQQSFKRQIKIIGAKGRNR